MSRGMKVGNQMRKMLSLVIAAAVLIVGAPAATASQGSLNGAWFISDSCANVREMFQDFRDDYPREYARVLKQIQAGDGMTIPAPPSGQREAAARQVRIIYFGYLEQIAAQAWPTTKDKTLRGILKNIADGKRVPLNALSLGRYCQAGNFPVR